jgi:predicted metal-dependent hydrolase
MGYIKLLAPKVPAVWYTKTLFMKWRIVRGRKKVKRASSVTKHYVVHREHTRELIHARLEHYNRHYALAWNRVAIRNQRRCWGSCTSLKNLNFSYKILFLPEHLQDYIVVHELCHLQELNHGKDFWALVAQQIPEYKSHIAELRKIEQGGMSYVRLEKLKENYNQHVVTGITK